MLFNRPTENKDEQVSLPLSNHRGSLIKVEDLHHSTPPDTSWSKSAYVGISGEHSTEVVIPLIQYKYYTKKLTIL